MNPYHAKYIAHDITLRRSIGRVESFTRALVGSSLQLLPHQIDAALFAHRSPFSEGVILADEVGLGKTIEAGLVVSRIWRPGESRVLVITPKSLRRQWKSELESKFSLPAEIVMNPNTSRNTGLCEGSAFDRAGMVVICTYKYAAMHSQEIEPVPWDVVICDEAHQLRNVDKPSTKEAKAIRRAIAGRWKLLLTATPLQNTVEELDGLLSFLDHNLRSGVGLPRWDHATQWALMKREERLGRVCKRTLRTDVKAYIKFTKRRVKLFEFDPLPEERELWNRVADFLARKPFHELGIRSPGFLEMVVWKLLASSHFAVAETLRKFADRFESDSELGADLDSIVEEDLEMESEDSVLRDDVLDSPSLVASDEARRRRMEFAQELRVLSHYATSIEDDRSAKAKSLLHALEEGFKQQADVGAPKGNGKAVVFTESRRTQEYLFRYLEAHGYRGSVVRYNGSNDDERSREILEECRRSSGRSDVDMTTALLAHFRDTASILLTTEAGAEGLNLQFCNLVINYDLPWNPQRIEQRIGRCHRIGQKFDVIVCNFINRSSVADRRVYDLLKDKVRLFKGIFGSSDEVLGAIISGTDLETEIAKIYSDCRTDEEINDAFDRLQDRVSAEIRRAKGRASLNLLHNFDQPTIERLFQVTQCDVAHQHDNRRRLARYLLGDSIVERDDGAIEVTREIRELDSVPVPKGTYRIGGDTESEAWGNFDTWLTEPLVRRGKAIATPLASVAMILESVAGAGRFSKRSGWVECRLLTLDSVDPEDFLMLAGVTDSGDELTDEECEAILEMPCDIGSAITALPDAVSKALDEIMLRNQRHLASTARRRLDAWGRDEGALSREWEQRQADHVVNLPTRIRSMMKKRHRRDGLTELEREYEDATKYRDVRLSMIGKQRRERVADVNDQVRLEERMERLFVFRWEALQPR